MLQLSTYTARTAYENTMIARMTTRRFADETLGFATA